MLNILCFSMGKVLFSNFSNLVGATSAKRHIGLTDGHTEGVYRWMDTSVVTLDEWKDLKGGDEENCVYLEESGQWASGRCHLFKQSICMAYQSR